jgi:hypothetical protein
MAEMIAVLQEVDPAQALREDRKTGQFYYRPEANDDARFPAVKDINPDRDLIRDALYCPRLEPDLCNNANAVIYPSMFIP